jgi:hypothetical protein
MKSKIFLLRLIPLPFILMAVTSLANAQSRQDSLEKNNLYKEIAHMDNVLFTAFNTRDIEKFKTLFAADLEFFHDKGGLTNYDYTINSLKETAKKNNGLRRDLVKGSLEVYPIPSYGALEIGVHTFCHLENGKQDCGTFKFVQVWVKKNGEWKISRVISYGH